MKKIIYILGILFLTIVIILNILFTAKLNFSECITIKFNSFIYIIGVISLSILIFSIARIINKYLYNDENLELKRDIRKKLFVGAIVLYVLFNVIWAIVINPKVIGDSVHVCNLAQTFYRRNSEELLFNTTYAGISLKQYMQSYPQQISLAFIFNIFFRIIHFDIMEVLRILNIIGNIFIVIALYKISNQLSKNYKTNKILLFTLILTFISLPMLVTFIYGDTPSLALCLFSVYFVMKYIEIKDIKYFVFTSILTMIAYMMRMNSLIFIIAIVIYLLLNLFKQITKKTLKQSLLNILIIVIYIAISLIPNSLVKNYYFKKYNLDKSKVYPTISYIFMAMEESPRGNGWYNADIAELGLTEPEKMKKEYLEKTRERLNYFSQNLGYTFNFYIMKITSMWAENTYSAVTNNKLDYCSLENIINPLAFYQKALLIITCLCSLIVLIKNRKNISLELLLLVTIFIGGFTFHILWEAKSRYIIPYIVILIPIASIGYNSQPIK